MEIELQNFDLEQIAASGQCFRMCSTVNGEMVILTRDKMLVAERIAEHKYHFGCVEQEFRDFWADYFDVNESYQNIINLAVREGDMFVLDAIDYGSGIRILRQDLWETVVSFLIARCKTISGISKCIERMCAIYGRVIGEHRDKKYYSFPSPYSIAEGGMKPLLDCGLGFRAKDILRISEQYISGEFDLECLRGATRQQAYEYLIKFGGIGPKVANCILLYGLHHIESVPEDVWIKRIRQTEYAGAEPWWYSTPYAGIIQQWVFYYKRMRGVDAA